MRGLCGRAAIAQSVALDFAAVAGCLVGRGAELHALLSIFLTCASKSLDDLGVLGSALAMERPVSPALSAALPAVFDFCRGLVPLVLQCSPTVPALHS